MYNKETYKTKKNVTTLVIKEFFIVGKLIKFDALIISLPLNDVTIINH